MKIQITYKTFHFTKWQKLALSLNSLSIFMTPDWNSFDDIHPSVTCCLSQPVKMLLRRKKTCTHEYTYLHTQSWPQRSHCKRKTVLKIKYNIKYMTIMIKKKLNIHIDILLLPWNHQVFWPTQVHVWLHIVLN